ASPWYLPSFLQLSLSGPAPVISHVLCSLEDRVAEHYTNVEFGPGISAIFEILYDANKYLQDNEPWKLRKTDPRRCETVLYVALEAARLSALLLQPIVPRSAAKMLDMLGVA